MITLTHNNLNNCTKNLHSSCIALNKQQLELLDIEWPPKSGWVKELKGSVVSDDVYDKLLKLRGKGKCQKSKNEKRKLALEREINKLGGIVKWVDKSCNANAETT